MPKPIWVVTPHTAFGELLRLSLEENGYQVNLIQSSGQILDKIDQSGCQLVILDADLPDQPVVKLGQELMQKNPDLRLVVVPTYNNPQHPSLAGLTPHGYISRPFFLPDLLETIHNLLGAPEPDQPQGAGGELPGSETAEGEGSVLRPGLLQQLMADFTAHATLVAAGGKAVARAGHLAPQAMDEMLGFLERYWDDEERADVARFVRLESTRAEHLLYAAHLTGRYILAMVFNVTMPLSRARAQISQMARLLIAHLEIPAEPEITPPAALQQDAPSSSPVEESPPEVVAPPAEEEKPPAASAFEQMLTSELAEELPAEEAGQAQLAELLKEFPQPKPAMPSANEWQPEIEDAQGLKAKEGEEEQKEEQEQPLFPWEKAAESSPENLEPEPTQQVGVPKDAAEEDLPLPAPQQDASLYSSAPAAGAPPEPEREIEKPAAGAAQTETQPQEEAAGAEPVLYPYTYVLIPQLPQHLLIGELGEQITAWLPEICQEYGWKLEEMTARPEYLQWTVKLDPNVAPGKLVRYVRQVSSRRIFEQFSYVKQQNPSGDFWAPGYLVLGGAQPPDEKTLRDFIRQTRLVQGY